MMIEDDTTDAGDNMKYAKQQNRNILPLLYPYNPYGTN